jgi:RNA polymerase sigma factor (sigma-70 family)
LVIRVRRELREDAAQIAALAELEGRDPDTAVEAFRGEERACGLGGENPPTVLRFGAVEPHAGEDGDEGDHIHGMHHAFDTPTAEALMIRREEAAERAAIGGAVLARLTKREREIITLQAQGWTQAEIAKLVGVTQPRVTQILAKIRAMARGYG